MRFESKKQREELIESFASKAEELTKAKIEQKGWNKNQNPKVTFDHRSEFDEVTRNASGEIDENSPCTGDIYVFYINQPKLFDAIKILDGGKQGEVYTKCLLAWDAMVDLKESSPEIIQDRIKLGYLLKMVTHIDALLGDQKKS